MIEVTLTGSGVASAEGIVNRRSNVTPDRRSILTPFARADGESARRASGWERGAWKRTALM